MRKGRPHRPKAPKSRKPDSPAIIPDRPWYKTAVGLIALPAASIGLASGAIALYTTLLAPVPVDNNIEIVVDASADSSSIFDGLPSERAVSGAVIEVTQGLSDSDNIGLRTFGGSCSRSGTTLAVPLHIGNIPNVVNAVQRIKPSGPRALLRGVVEATGDFNDPARFDRRSKRIILITSGEDQCPSEIISATDYIKKRLRDTGVKADLFIVGVKIPFDARERLSQIANSAGGEVSFADNRAELSSLVHSALSASSPQAWVQTLKADLPANNSSPPLKPQPASVPLAPPPIQTTQNKAIEPTLPRVASDPIVGIQSDEEGKYVHIYSDGNDTKIHVDTKLGEVLLTLIIAIRDGECVHGLKMAELKRACLYQPSRVVRTIRSLGKIRTVRYMGPRAARMGIEEIHRVYFEYGMQDWMISLNKNGTIDGQWLAGTSIETQPDSP